MHWSDSVPPKGDFRITLTGDWAPVRAYAQPMIDDPVGVYGDLLPVFAESDLNIVNIECVMGERGAPIPKPGPALQGSR